MDYLVPDVPYRFCLVDYFGDAEGLDWHMRMLVIPSGQGDARWVWATPDYEVQAGDLSEHRVIPLVGGRPLPAQQAQATYAFDAFGPGELDDVVARARALAALLGFRDAGVEVPSGEQWRVADPSHPSFGLVVPAVALLDPDCVRVEGDRGLVCIEGEGRDPAWTFMQRVGDDKVEAWRAQITSGAGRDPRVLPLRTVAGGQPERSETSALDSWRCAKTPHSPHRGPPAAVEFFESLRASGLTTVTHHANFVKRSGIPPRGHVAREHEALCEILRLMSCHDQLDISSLASGELSVRRLLVLEAAVSRNPRNPDFDGLDIITSARVNDVGAIQTQKFTEWVSSVQKDEAVVLKAGRQLREERAAEGRRSNNNKKKEEGQS